MFLSTFCLICMLFYWHARRTCIWAFKLDINHMALYTHTKVISVYRIAEIFPGQIFHQAQLTLRYRNIQWNKFSPMLKWTGQKICGVKILLMK